MIRLNLLPPEIKENIEYARKNAALYQLLLKMFAVFAVVAGLMVIVGSIVYYGEVGATEELGVAKSQLAAWNNAEKDAKDLAARLTLISKLKSEDLNWPVIFAEMAKSTPPNIRLSAYDFTSNAKNRVTITGFALSTEDIGKYKELMSSSKLFKFIDVESISQGNDPADSAVKGYLFTASLNLDQTEARK
jgi:Tfp pilus assembly protein PilN